MEFLTSVRGTQMKITPRVIGEVIGLRPSMTGSHYLKGRSLTDASWKTVVNRICVPDAQTHGIYALSKDLLPEYRFLNFIICYNIQPNMNTKVLRWDRMLLMFLLGHPSEGAGLNFNIPYLIWSRMARYVEHSHVQERLPFPLIIMRLLRKFGVSTQSTSYQYSLGTINDSTVVKSLPKPPEESSTPPRGRMPSASTAPRQATASGQGTSSRQAPSAPSTASGEEASVTSIYREQQRLSSEQERISQSQAQICQSIETLTAAHVSLTSKFKTLKRMLKKLMGKMGCPPSDDSSADG